jgi:hypothetical protein
MSNHDEECTPVKRKLEFTEEEPCKRVLHLDDFDPSKFTLISIVHWNECNQEAIYPEDIRKYSVPNDLINESDRRLLWMLDGAISEIGTPNSRRLLVLLGDDSIDRKESDLTWGAWDLGEREWGCPTLTKLGRSYDCFVQVVIRHCY